jgi:hypothetical protein
MRKGRARVGQPLLLCSVGKVGFGELFVDFAAQTVPIADPLTGTVRAAQIFVAALGASYIETHWSQGRADWIGCHVGCVFHLREKFSRHRCTIDGSLSAWQNRQITGGKVQAWTIRQ